MDQDKKNKIAESWIRLHNSKQDSTEYENEFWSFETIDELIHQEPNDALEVILAIAELCNNEKILANLGAGPIEDLMLYFGPEFIDRVEVEAKKNLKFKRALKSVWLDPEETSVWQRLNKITKNEPPL
jgi:hypothetical protein